MKLHPDAPRRLKRLFRKLGSVRKVAKECGVNPRYAYDLLINGKAPGNPNIAEALFVEQRCFSRLDLGDRRRRHIRWFMRLPRMERSKLILELYSNREQTDKENGHEKSKPAFG